MTAAPSTRIPLTELRERFATYLHQPGTHTIRARNQLIAILLVLGDEAPPEHGTILTYTVAEWPARQRTAMQQVCTNNAQVNITKNGHVVAVIRTSLPASPTSQGA